jgi:hypothetical protein
MPREDLHGANSLVAVVGVKAVYATTQPPEPTPIPLVTLASMGVEDSGTGSDSGWPERMKASEAKKSMDPDVF